MRSHPPLPQTMQVALVPLGLVSTNCRWFPIVHIQRSCHCFRKPRQSSWLSNLRVRTQTTRNVGGAYAWDKLNIRANAPSPLFSTSSMQKKEAYFWELTVHDCSYPKSINGPHKMSYLFIYWVHCIVFKQAGYTEHWLVDWLSCFTSKAFQFVVKLHCKHTFIYHIT